MKLRTGANNLVTSTRWRSRQNLLRLGIFLAVLALVGAAVLLHKELDLEQVGYAGLGLTVLLASGGLVLPIPSLATACGAGALLNPLYVALVAGSAGTLGELTGYYLGYSGQGIVDRTRLYKKMEGWMRRGGWLVLFLLALIPNPIFDLGGNCCGSPTLSIMAILGCRVGRQAAQVPDYCLRVRSQRRLAD